MRIVVFDKATGEYRGQWPLPWDGMHLAIVDDIIYTALSSGDVTLDTIQGIRVNTWTPGTNTAGIAVTADAVYLGHRVSSSRVSITRHPMPAALTDALPAATHTRYSSTFLTVPHNAALPHLRATDTAVYWSYGGYLRYGYDPPGDDPEVQWYGFDQSIEALSLDTLAVYASPISIGLVGEGAAYGQTLPPRVSGYGRVGSAGGSDYGAPLLGLDVLPDNQLCVLGAVYPFTLGAPLSALYDVNVIAPSGGDPNVTRVSHWTPTGLAGDGTYPMDGVLSHANLSLDGTDVYVAAHASGAYLKATLTGVIDGVYGTGILVAPRDIEVYGSRVYILDQSPGIYDPPYPDDGLPREIASVIDEAGLHHVVSEVSGQLTYRRAIVGQAWTITTSLGSGTRPALALDRGTLRLVYQNAVGTLLCQESTNAGASWGSVTWPLT